MLASESIVLYDAVTLYHFAHVTRLSVPESVHGYRPSPHWGEVVHSEITAGLNHLRSFAQAKAIIGSEWLGDPQSATDMSLVFRFQAALAANGDAPEKNLGEAESIVLALELGGSFVTDDRGAHAFASHPRQLGPKRVLTMCQVLDLGAADGMLDAKEVREIHRGVDAVGRRMLCDCKM